MSETSAAMEVAERIADELGWTLGVQLFISREPEMPDDVTTVYDVNTTRRGYVDGTPDWEEPTGQVRCRGRVYTELWVRAAGVAAVLKGMAGWKTTEARYDGVPVVSGPAYIGVDQKGRQLVVVNFRAARQRGAGH